jgi:hypothetical protein
MTGISEEILSCLSYELRLSTGYAKGSFGGRGRKEARARRPGLLGLLRDGGKRV